MKQAIADPDSRSNLVDRNTQKRLISKDGAHRIGWTLAPGSGDALKLLKSFGAQPALSGGECLGSDRTCPT
jgi:hypothetical protein